ncbi:MAG: alpha-L-rhamnosidase [Bacteroidaceae bacterium]|nr:alpha-L-rhamnosidase [Bacteroidaceae bacterium]
MKRIINIICIFATCLMVQAQTALPPVWKDVHQEKVQVSSRTVAYLPPTRIVWQETTGDASIEGLEKLLSPGIGQAELVAGKECRIRNGAQGKASFLLDFGKELQGGIQLVTGFSSKKETRIRVRFGESASEAMCDITTENGATNDHAIRDFQLVLPWLGVAEIGNSGFRFVRIDLEEPDAVLMLKEVRATFGYRDIPYLGSFKSDNERLNDIWMTGAYTVHLNMQEYIWDGVKRDRLVWIGDLHPELMTVNTVFGYNEVIPKSLDLIRDTTPVPNWMNGISSYSIWWLLIHKDWYLYQGNLDYLKEQKVYMTTLLNHLMTKIDDNGKETLDGTRFLDWPSSPNVKGVDAGLQALMVMAMEAGHDMALAMGDKSLAERCKKASKKLKKYTPDHNQSKQGAALMALAGLMKAEKADKEVLSVGGAKNFSTFYGYYMLEAMAKAGNYQGAMDIISEYWGAMLDLGATTFWEDFNIDWMENAARIDELVPEGKVDVHSSYGGYCYVGFRHSFCHGWASGPTAWLSRYVLGVQVLEPGCKKVKIEPHLGNLNRVEGSFPTPLGVIRIKHEKGADGKIRSDIQAPEGVEIIK